MTITGSIEQPAGPGETPLRKPWVTLICCLICLAVFIAFSVSDENDEQKKLAMVGYCSAMEIWSGDVWGLITSSFIHAQVWHCFFNLYWLWKLGCCMERYTGSWVFLAFYLAAAIVTSTFQMAAGDSTGIGASGVLYAMFGYLWYARRHIPAIQQTIDERTIQMMFWWLFICIGLSVSGTLAVGNVSHFSGLLFGILVASAFVVHDRPGLSLLGLNLSAVLTVILLVWCPWSVSWLAAHAYQAHLAGDLGGALEWYSRIIVIDPENQWARQNQAQIESFLKAQEDDQHVDDRG